mgnify:CR=1 FL=1
MDIAAEERRRAFSVWLRTGRWPTLLRSVELKFNPWHDPENGRFTFAGTGRYFGRGNHHRSSSSNVRPGSGSGRFRGDDGSFGGGGATGSWAVPAERRPQPPRDTIRQPVRQSAYPSRPATATPVRREAVHGRPDLPPGWRRVVRNGYEYLIDAQQRTRRVSGTLTLNNEQRRSRTAQAQAGGDERRTSDHGGHYIARRLNGPTEAFNHFAQDASFNRGRYRTLENQWARAQRAGKEVTVKIVPAYDGQSQRHSAINVWFWIDGDEESLNFPNERQETSRAHR